MNEVSIHIDVGLNTPHVFESWALRVSQVVHYQDCWKRYLYYLRELEDLIIAINLQGVYSPLTENHS